MAWSTCCSVTGMLLGEEHEREKMEFLDSVKCRVGKNLVWGRTGENNEEAAIAIVIASLTMVFVSFPSYQRSSTEWTIGPHLPKLDPLDPNKILTSCDSSFFLQP